MRRRVTRSPNLASRPSLVWLDDTTRTGRVKTPGFLMVSFLSLNAP
jgi:hypothetical protein